MDVLERCVEPYLERSLFPQLYFPAFQELRFAQHRGDYTVIMSSSPSFIVSRVAKSLGVDEWLATEYQLDSSQCLIGIQKFIDGEAKAEALSALLKKQGVAKEHVAAYSDSYRDLPFLQLAGQPVAVNPDSKLQAFSKLQRWRIL